jgi:hypothetical protein
MNFPWWEPKIPARARATAAARRETMYLRELEERAALLKRLQYSRDRCRQRLAANVRWDFELHKAPAFLARIDAIVDAAYGKGSRRGGPPSLE